MKTVVVFDLDGTLVDSEDFIVWSFVKAGELVGVEVDPEVIRSSIGMPLELVVERAFLNRGVPVSLVKVFLEVRRKLVEEHWRSRVSLYPDVIPVLRVLRDMGLILAVASSSVTKRIVDFLSYFGVLEYFHVVSGVNGGTRGKPEPDVILEALKSVGRGAEEAVYVGDREVDCVAATRAHVDFVLIDRRGVFSEQRFACRPVGVIRSLLELPLLVKRL